MGGSGQRAVFLAVDNQHADDEARPERDMAATRVAEAVIFASSAPVSPADLALHLPAGVDPGAVLADVERLYATRGVNLVRVGGGWTFRTAADLSSVLAREPEEPRKLSRAAMEVLAIIAYHQPTTRAEVEEIRGIATSKGTLDALLETRWIRMRGRRKSPGRPITYGTTREFLQHFGLDAVTDLPGLEELQGLGMLDRGLSAHVTVPTPSDDVLLTPEEEPLDADLMSLGPSGSPEE